MTPYSQIQLIIDDNTPHGRLAAGLPDSFQTDAFTTPPERPALLLVQSLCPSHHDAVIRCLKSRTPVAILDAMDDDTPAFNALARLAARNHVPAVLLGAWRYIPAAAALRELADSLCIGNSLHATVTAPVDTPLNALRADDLAGWLAKDNTIRHKPGDIITVELTGQYGAANASFQLNGTKASFTATVAGFTHERTIPPGEPLASEIAVLGLSRTPGSRIHALPMLMCLKTASTT